MVSTSTFLGESYLKHHRLISRSLHLALKEELQTPVQAYVGKKIHNFQFKNVVARVNIQ
jgi:hypothetical protein